MIISPDTLYWITRLDSAHELCTILTIIFTCLGALCLMGAVISAGVCITSGDYNDDDDIRCFKACRKWVLVCCICLGLVCAARVLLPTTKEMAMIIVIPAIVNSDFVQEDLPREAKELYNLAKQAAVRQLTGSDLPIKEQE